MASWHRGKRFERVDVIAANRNDEVKVISSIPVSGTNIQQ
jgi:hypothetical protein